MLDCSIIALTADNKKNLNLISSTDYFYPIVDDPYIFGRIGAANVLSDLYCLGIGDIDNILMILGASNKIENKEHRNIVTSSMISGFVDSCKLADVPVTGGHSVINPWPIIGGCAQSVVHNNEYISPYNGKPGNTLVLTKPLGTQVAVNIAEWKTHENEKYHKLKEHVSDDVINKIHNIAKGSMMNLNRNAAKLMSGKYKKYVNGATDVTGFGLLGHAQNLCIHQKVNANNNGMGMQFVIDKLPIIKYCNEIDAMFDGMFKLQTGFSAETSGGLMIMMSDAKAANDFVCELHELDGWPAWIIGHTQTTKSDIDMSNAAVIDNDFDFIEVFD